MLKYKIIYHSSGLDGKHLAYRWRLCPKYKTLHLVVIQLSVLSQCLLSVSASMFGKKSCHIFGPQLTHNVSEEVSRNTPTILLQWILPVREIWNSDTHIQCVCVWWRTGLQSIFDHCNHHEEREKGKGRKEGGKRVRMYRTRVAQKQSQWILVDR